MFSVAVCTIINFLGIYQNVGTLWRGSSRLEVSSWSTRTRSSKIAPDLPTACFPWVWYNTSDPYLWRRRPLDHVNMKPGNHTEWHGCAFIIAIVFAKDMASRKIVPNTSDSLHKLPNSYSPTFPRLSQDPILGRWCRLMQIFYLSWVMPRSRWSEVWGLRPSDFLVTRRSLSPFCSNSIRLLKPKYWGREALNFEGLQYISPMVSDSDKSDLNKSDKTGTCWMSKQLFLFTRDSYLFYFQQANIIVLGLSESLSVPSYAIRIAFKCYRPLIKHSLHLWVPQPLVPAFDWPNCTA